jgi:hypothetical protein
MNWIATHLEAPKKKGRKEKTVIKGIAQIEGKYYYLDYIVLSNFRWYRGVELNEDILSETNDSASKKIKLLELNLFFDSNENKFYDLKDVDQVKAKIISTLGEKALLNIIEISNDIEVKYSEKELNAALIKLETN